MADDDADASEKGIIKDDDDDDSWIVYMINSHDSSSRQVFTPH